MLRYGITVIADEHANALRGTVAVYAADIKLHEEPMDPTLMGEHVQVASHGMLNQGAEWLVAQAAARSQAPPPARITEAPRRLGTRQSGVSDGAPPALGVPGVVDPDVGDLPQ